MTSALRRRAFVVCGAISPFVGKGHPNYIDNKHPKYGVEFNPTLRDYITGIGRRALHHHNGFEVPAEYIERCWVGNFVGELFVNQGHLGSAVADIDPHLMYKPSMRVEGACASGGLAFASAVTAIEAGMDLGLVIGAEVQNTASARQGGDYLARASHYSRQRPLDDFTFPAMFARRMKAYLQAHKVTLRDVAHTSYKAFSNARRNGKAHTNHNTATLETCDGSPFFLGNPDLRNYLRMSDCSQVSDGGAAVVVASLEGLDKLGLRPSDCVEVLTCESAAGNLYEDTDLLVMDTSRECARRAYERTNTRPQDMDMVEVHDCFTIAEALMLEALGIVPPGKGVAAARDGVTTFDGRTPCNPGGGLVGGGHPVGATGVKQIIQASKQMWGIAGGYQLHKTVKTAITVNMGGDDKSSVVTILRSGKAL